jgi:hypothetical protein
MPSASTPSRSFDRGEPIPGYRTEELLGRGGYGEVWRAIAPGGIAKAVKIVYGDVDTSHADAELRSLARIKDVRHPLLLSIERIEVVDGNLIIVTEMADHSLKDEFLRHRDAHFPGVPQDVLMQYVSDAAEALDFLYSRYSLQHLDVKPENILIVSGRAKVGDFGLVKNLYERSVSLVGGLTPTYAPPELFEGRPTRHSDQYSLAILYAHMLTGVLPFHASNTAQLAALHLRGVPDLSALTKRQRPVIARALSKDPLQRFASCTEMVQALKDSVTANDFAPAIEGAAGSRTRSRAELPQNERAPERGLPAPSRIADPAAAAITRAAGDSSGNPMPRPIVLVGVGGAGTDVLSRVVNRLHERFGESAGWPAVGLLAIDSQPRELNSRFHDRDRDLDHVHLVPIPLKPADSFGSQTASVLKWLGRRWFYNIPRDLTTRGLRPLGRLALLTHGPRVRDAIAAVLSDAASRFHGEAAAGADPAPTPRVLVIGSICGGTGGGALLDLAYALRSELKRRHHSDECVHGILLHASPRSQADRDMARANAYATLNELQHFSRPGGYFPGEPLLGAMPFHGDNATFAGTHLLDLGIAGEPAEHELAAEQAAEFIFDACFAAGGQLLSDAADARNGNAPDAGTALPRSYDVLSLGAGMASAVERAIRLTCRDVIRLWQEGSSPPTEPKHSSRLDQTQIITLVPKRVSAADRRDELAHRKIVECGLDLESLLSDAAEVIRLESGSEPEALVRRLIDECLTATTEAADQATRTNAAIDLIDRFLRGETREGVPTANDNQFFSQLVGRLVGRVRERSNALVDWLRSQVDSADVRINGARRLAAAMEQQFQSMLEASLTTAAALRETALTVGVAATSEQATRPERSRFFGLGPRRRTPEDKFRDVLNAYAEARLHETLYRTVSRVVPSVVSAVATLIEQLDRLSRDFAGLAGSVRDTGTSWTTVADELPTGASPSAAAFQQLLLSQLRLRNIEMALRVDKAIGQQLFDGGHGIRRFLDSETDLQRLLWHPLQEEARRIVLESLDEIKGQLIQLAGSNAAGDESSELATLIAASFRSGAMDDPPGVSYRLLFVPANVDSSRLEDQLRPLAPELQIVRGPKCDITLCTIHTRPRLEHAADEIIAGLDTYRELAGRLQSRIDIAWQGFRDDAGAASGVDHDPSNALPTVPMPP